AETPMSSNRRRLTADAFHHAAIPAQRDDVVCDDLVPWTILVRSQPAARHGHADTGGHSLSQWPSGRLDTRGQRVIWSIFGVSRTFAVQPSEVRELGEREIKAIDMQGTVQQHRGVTTRQNKAVAIEPA